MGGRLGWWVGMSQGLAEAAGDLGPGALVGGGRHRSLHHSLPCPLQTVLCKEDSLERQMFLLINPTISGPASALTFDLLKNKPFVLILTAARQSYCVCSCSRLGHKEGPVPCVQVAKALILSKES